MVGTRAKPNRKLTKEHLESRAKGHIRKHTAQSKLKPPPETPSLKTPADVPDTDMTVARPLANTPPITPIINITGRPPGKPITRNDIPTCLDFGKFRRIMYPDALFCSPCDWWEEELHHRPLSMSLNQIKKRVKMYECKCQHTSFVQPLQPTIDDLPSNNSNLSLAASSHLPTSSKPLPTRFKKYDPKALLMSSGDELSEFLSDTLEITADSELEQEDEDSNLSSFVESDNPSPVLAVPCNGTFNTTPDNQAATLSQTQEVIISTKTEDNAEQQSNSDLNIPITPRILHNEDITHEKSIELSGNKKMDQTYVNDNNLHSEHDADPPVLDKSPSNTVNHINASTLGIHPTSDMQTTLKLKINTLRSSLKVAEQ